MAIKKYQRTAQLFDKNNADLYEGTSLSRTDEWYYAGGQATIIRIPCESSTTYTLKITASDTVFRISTIATDDIPVEGGSSVSATTVVNSGTITEYTFTTSNDAKYILFQGSYAVLTTILNTLMLNLGSTSLPYEPYGNTWNSIPYRKYGTETDTITTFPADVIADGQSASADIIGNMVQTGTPSPSSIIMPDECGDKTANLFDKSTIIYGKWTNSAGSAQDYAYGARTVDISASVITIKIYGVLPYSFSVCWLDSNKGFIERWHEANPSSSNSYTLNPPQNAEYFYLQVANGTDSANPITAEQIASYQIMLNTGSTALPYQPYGYKIPILSANTTTNVYLGEVQSERQIKKLVLTGEESWARNESSGSRYYFRLPDVVTDGIVGQIVCSHYVSPEDTISASNTVQGTRIQDTSQYGRCLLVRTPNYTTDTVTDFKTYLQQQYAAGTPVTVWYVLATPTTTTLNEPIRKIGTYADSVAVSNVPTTGTAESFDIDTTLKPSEVDLTYHGWHEHSDTKFTG